MVDIGLFEKVRRFVKEQLEAQNVPSLAVAVARGGDILWEEAFGWADREKGIVATEHTIYSLASISKPFTATALSLLCERGQIDLERPVNEYLGPTTQITGWAGDAVGVTVARLVNHTGGLPRHFQFFFQNDPPPYNRPPSMEQTIRRYGNVVLPPGEAFLYSNLGYGILGYLVERVSGQSYGAFLQSEVFEPLGLTHTFVEEGPEAVGAERVIGWAREEGIVATRYERDGHTALPAYWTDHPGASAVFSSVHDLVRFGMFHAGSLDPVAPSSLLAPAVRERMQQPISGAKADQAYGLGWFLGKSITGHPSLAHGGGMDGVSTRLYLIPSEQIVIAVLANTDTELPGQIFREIMPVLFGQSAREQSSQTPATGAGNGEETPPLPKWLTGCWKGHLHTYREALSLQLTIPSTGAGSAQIGDARAEEVPLRDLLWENGVLTAEFQGDIKTEDANRRPYTLQLTLRLPGGVGTSSSASALAAPRPATTLQGYVTARTSTPGQRLGNALSHWVELTRV